MAYVPSGTGNFLAAPTNRCARSVTSKEGYLPMAKALAVSGAGYVFPVSLSTRTYIILAALTGMAILVAFAVQTLIAR
jgi:hypothetical protein